MKVLYFSALLVAFTASQALGAQEVTLEGVEVTANKISQNLKDVPQSIDVINGTELEEKGIKNVSELLKSVPNMNGQTGMYEGISTRGLNPSIFTSSNPVTIYVGGVAQSNKDASYIPLSNIERVEILRGPSSTIYGKDSIGGVINVVLKEPSNDWHGGAGLEYGTRKYRLATFDASGALIPDKLFLGLNGSVSKQNGWIINDLDSKYANGKQNYNLGLNLKIVPTDRLSIKLYGDFFNRKDKSLDDLLIAKSQFFSIKKSDAKHIDLENDAYVKQRSNQGAIDLKYEFDKFDLTSTTTYREVRKDGIYDEDFGSKKTYLDPDHNGLITFLNLKDKTLSQELRLSSNEEPEVKWVGGIYLEDEKQNFKSSGDQYKDTGNTVIEDWPSTTSSKTASTFGQITYPLTSKLDLTLGARAQQIRKHTKVDYYSYNMGSNKGAPQFSLDEKAKFNAFLPKVALGYDLNENLNIYAMYSKGYLAGGFNFYTMGGSVEDNKFQAQTSDNYEIGVKGAYENLRFLADVFYMDIKNTHIIYNDPANPNSYATSNAKKSKSMGVELESVLRATNELELNFAASLLKTKYGDYLNKDGSNNKGNRIERNPEYKLSLGASYYAPFGVYARLDTNLIGKTFFDAKNEIYQKSYCTIDTKVGYLKDSFDIYFYVKNLTNKEYFSYARDKGRNVLATYGDGRVFGIGVKYTF